MADTDKHSYGDIGLQQIMPVLDMAVAVVRNRALNNQPH